VQNSAGSEPTERSPLLRTNAVGALARPFLPLLGLLVAGTLFPGEARAEGRITLTKMFVQTCEELGDCEWRLTCRAGDQKEVELFSGAKARAGRTVDLKNGFDVGTFPVELTCTLYEDDGFMSESWTKAGEASLDLPAGGDYKLNIQGPGQGAVRVQMIVDQLEIQLPSPAAPAAGGRSARAAAKPEQIRFLGVYTPRPEGQTVIVGQDWDTFKATASRLDEEGIKLIGIESFPSGGKILWGGLFRDLDDRSMLLGVSDWDAFVNDWKKVSSGSMRLEDFEVFTVGNDVKAAGLYRPGSDSYSLWVGQKLEDFKKKRTELNYSKSLRVNDFEIYQAYNTRLYAGGFRGAARTPELWTGLDQAGLTAKVKQARNLQLTDLETYKEGNKRLYDALLSQPEEGLAVPVEIVFEADQATFLRRWKEMIAKGYRLVELEVYRE
jgi:hypothetical protein